MTGKRTKKQNDSLHLYFEWLAQTLNDAGLDMRTVLKPEIEIPWKKQSVKDFLWRPIQKLVLHKQSTTELNSAGDITEVYDVLNRHIAKFGIHVPFPSLELWGERVGKKIGAGAFGRR